MLAGMVTALILVGGGGVLLLYSLMNQAGRRREAADRRLREVERVLRETLACMTLCMWLNEKRARPLYESLTRRSPRIYNPALVRVFLGYKYYRRVVCLAVKVGMPGSEERLAQILHAYGTKEIATDFLNSGSPALAAAAREWATLRAIRSALYQAMRARLGAASELVRLEDPASRWRISGAMGPDILHEGDSGLDPVGVGVEDAVFQVELVEHAAL
jgi:hypothetical protein